MARTKHWLVEQVEASVQKGTKNNVPLGTATRALVQRIQDQFEETENLIEKLRERVARLEKKGKENA